MVGFRNMFIGYSFATLQRQIASATEEASNVYKEKVHIKSRLDPSMWEAMNKASKKAIANPTHRPKFLKEVCNISYMLSRIIECLVYPLYILEILTLTCIYIFRLIGILTLRKTRDDTWKIVNDCNNNSWGKIVLVALVEFEPRGKRLS